MSGGRMLIKYGTSEEVNLGKTLTVTAFAGGGQANATALSLKWNIITTCASDNDSVKLLAGAIGSRQVVFNNTANVLSVFPVSGESINGVTDNEFKVGAGQVAIFESQKTGQWTQILTPTCKKYVAILSQTGTGAPVATIGENTIGDIVWTRDSMGHYLGTLVGAFDGNVIPLALLKISDTDALIIQCDNSDDALDLTTINPTDYSLVDGWTMSIEIKVY